MAYQVEEIPIEKIKVQKHNVRLQNIDAGVDDLATSIKAHGLLEPIVAYRSGDLYHLLAGQRRLNAFHNLNASHPGGGFDRIPCFIRDEPENDDQKKALSLAENITQLPMNESDLVKAVTDLYNVYGDYGIVQREFGLSRHMVNKYVKMSRLPPELKAAISSGELGPKPRNAVNMAIRAVDAYNYIPGGEVAVGDVVKLAKAMASGAVDQQDAEKGVRMGKTIKEIEAMKDDRVQIRVHLSADVNEKLDRVAQSRESQKIDVAALYIVEGVERDYPQAEEQQ